MEDKTEEIYLRKLDDSLMKEYLDLSVFDCQKTFIETPKGSLEDKERSGWDIDWTIECIFAGGKMAGYAMHGESKDGYVWLDRFMTDRRFQNRGIGKAALSLIIEKLKKLYPDRKKILLSVVPENRKAIKLYEKAGFVRTGKFDEGEEIMYLSEDTHNA